MTTRKKKPVQLPHGELKVYTPGMALELIEKSEAAGHINRSISDHKVAQWTFEMKNDWDPAASTIVIDQNGILIDGYHRMYACIMAEVPFTTFVITTPDGQRTVTKVDTNRARGGGDLLHMEGWKYATGLASAARLKLRNDQAGYMWATSHPVTNTMVVDYINGQRKLCQRMVSEIPGGTAQVMSVTKYFYLHFTARSYDLAQEFLYQVIHGYRTDESGLPKNDCTFVLRERLRTARMAKATNRHQDKLDPRQEIYLICTLYKKWLSGEKTTRVQLPKLVTNGVVRTQQQAYKLPKNI